MSERPPPREALRAEALALLLAGSSYRNAAAKVGISEATIWRWAREPDFREALEGQRAAVVSEARQRISLTVGRAIEVLADLLDGADTPPAVRRQAAIDLLDRAGIPRVSEVLLRDDRAPDADDVAAWLAEQAAENAEEPEGAE